MPVKTASRSIDATVDRVFDVVAHIENFSKAIPHIKKIEFLTDQKRGVGARFRETREMKGREVSSVLEVTEYVENDRIRYVSDEGGMIWDSIFQVKPEGDGTSLLLEMDARPHKLLSKLITPMMMGMVGKAVESDMDSVKEYCEAKNAGGGW
ncbi:MAG: SRPBCC family protein [Pseudomonadota bacterium]